MRFFVYKTALAFFGALFLVVFIFSFSSNTHAAVVDATSTNFSLEGSSFDSLGGESTSTSFLAGQQIPYIAGDPATSTSFIVDSDFFATFSTSTITLSTSTGGGGGGGSGGSSGGGGIIPNVPSQYSPSISSTLPAISTTTASVIETIIDTITGIFKPKPPPYVVGQIPIEQIVPKKAPLALRSAWHLIPRPPLLEYVFRPLPVELQNLAGQLPQLGKLFADVGIHTFNDLPKLRNISLRVPGLGDVLALPKGATTTTRTDLRIADLTPELRSKFPKDILFAKFAGGLVDVKPTLRLGENGQTEQVIKTVVGSTLTLSIKPAFPAASVTGYFVFKNRVVPAYLTKAGTDSSFAASVIEQTYISTPLPSQMPTALVVDQFTFTDPDNDGIYTVNVVAPVTEGEYEIVTAITYKDPSKGTQLLRMITVIDPTGYVYEAIGNKQVRLPDAQVTLEWLNPKTNNYEMWPAREYQQDNPQVTNVTGRYSFLVPPGMYQLKVSADGYADYKGRPFAVNDGSSVHEDIPLQATFRFWRTLDWKTLLFGLLCMLVIYHIYRDKIKESKSRGSFLGGRPQKPSPVPSVQAPKEPIKKPEIPLKIYTPKPIKKNEPLIVKSVPIAPKPAQAPPPQREIPVPIPIVKKPVVPVPPAPPKPPTEIPIPIITKIKPVIPPPSVVKPPEKLVPKPPSTAAPGKIEIFELPRLVESDPIKTQPPTA